MDIEFDGDVFEWRGPSPYYFVAVPADLADELQDRVRRAESVDEGDTVTVRLTVDLGDGDEAG